MQKYSTFSLLPQRFVETGTWVAESAPLPDRTGPDAFLLAVSAVTRRAKGRALVHQEHGHRLRARDARKSGERVRRLLVRQAIAERAPEQVSVSEPMSRPEASEPSDARPSATALPVEFVERDASGSLLERIGAYSAVAAPSMLRRR